MDVDIHNSLRIHDNGGKDGMARSVFEVTIMVGVVTFIWKGLCMCHK